MCLRVSLPVDHSPPLVLEDFEQDLTAVREASARAENGDELATNGTYGNGANGTNHYSMNSGATQSHSRYPDVENGTQASGILIKCPLLLFPCWSVWAAWMIVAIKIVGDEECRDGPSRCSRQRQLCCRLPLHAIIVKKSSTEQPNSATNVAPTRSPLLNMRLRRQRCYSNSRRLRRSCKMSFPTLSRRHRRHCRLPSKTKIDRLAQWMVVSSCPPQPPPPGD